MESDGRTQSPTPASSAPCPRLEGASRSRRPPGEGRERLIAATCLVLALAGGTACGGDAADAQVPTGPVQSHVPRVIYDNDDIDDVYTDEYVMALAAAGDIDLAGIITTTSVEPFNHFVGNSDYQRIISQRSAAVALARSSGFAGIPDPVRGPRGHLEPPSSGRIDDTMPLDSEGGRLIVREAAGLPAGERLVVLVGGPLTAVADAYLLDPAIADAVTVHWLGGGTADMGDYNGWADPWAAYVVLERLDLIQFPAKETGVRAAPQVAKDDLADLPDAPLVRWMIDKRHPSNGMPRGRDADAPPVVGLMRDDYAATTRRVSFDGWIEFNGRDVAAFREDPAGGARVVLEADGAVATAAWWDRLSDPDLYRPDGND